jgi:hypothetical protein
MALLDIWVQFPEPHGGSQPSVMGSDAHFWCVWRQWQFKINLKKNTLWKILAVHVHTRARARAHTHTHTKQKQPCLVKQKTKPNQEQQQQNLGPSWYDKIIYWFSTYAESLTYFKLGNGADEIAQRVRALTALPKVLSSNPSNHMVAHNHP